MTDAEAAVLAVSGFELDEIVANAKTIQEADRLTEDLAQVLYQSAMMFPDGQDHLADALGE
jgi:hypothetical protein